MEETSTDFNSQVKEAISSKTQWYDTNLLPKMEDNYRLHLSAVRVLYDELQKKSLIVPDPYKKDKKISDVSCPDDSEYNDTERAVQIGIRFSEYESTLDFICNYMKFSCESLTMDKIKKLLLFNAAFNWQNLSMNSQKHNTRGLAYCISQLKTSASQIQLSNLSDALYKTTQALGEINNALKELAGFQKETYKAQVRENVLANSSFNRQACTSPEAMVQEIKKLWSNCMPKRNFASELINEIAQEEVGPNKDELRSKLLSTLSIPVAKVVKKKQTVDTHESLMDAIRTIGSLCNQYDAVLAKIKDNHDLLESEHDTFIEKLLNFFRQMFGKKNGNADYELVLTDKTNSTKKTEMLNYFTFSESLEKRSRYYASITVKTAPGYQKINMQKDDAILEFLHKQISETLPIHDILAALDELFKSNINTKERQKIRGIKMELTTIKNLIIKANQQCAEYSAYIEEQKQMEKLGITNE